MPPCMGLGINLTLTVDVPQLAELIKLGARIMGIAEDLEAKIDELGGSVTTLRGAVDKLTGVAEATRASLDGLIASGGATVSQLEAMKLKIETIMGEVHAETAETLAAADAVDGDPNTPAPAPAPEG